MNIKHNEIIRAWLDGAQVQCKTRAGWCDTSDPWFHEDVEYRVKPKDVVRYSNVYIEGGATFRNLLCDAHRNATAQSRGTVKYTFDGEDGKLKQVEIVE